MRAAMRSALAAALCLAATAAAQTRVPMPVLEVDRNTSCVAPPDVMRRTHMDLLMHRRDRTVHQGVRGGDEALARCISCHAGSKGAAIGNRDAFCQSCHDYVAVKLDCFECHQGRPGAVATSR